MTCNHLFALVPFEVVCLDSLLEVDNHYRHTGMMEVAVPSKYLVSILGYYFK